MRSGFFFFLGLLSGSLATALLIRSFSSSTNPIWVEVLLLFGVSGAFGGILAAIQLARIPNLFKSSEYIWQMWRPANVALALLASAFGGVGGAGAAMYVMLLVGKIAKGSLEDLDRLTYVSTGLLAGFLGFSLLKKVAEGFGDALRLRDVEDKVDQERKERLRNELATAVNLGRAAQNTKKPPTPEELATVNAAVEALTRMRKEFPADRSAAQILGWLLANRLEQRLQNAIEVLDSAVAALAEGGLQDSKDCARLMYNRACYHYRFAMDQTLAEAARADHKRRMYEDLARVLRIEPAMAGKALADTAGDFVNVLGEDQFRRLTAQPPANAGPPAQPPANAGP